MNDRQRWLEERKNGIGGSDAAAILGLSPYMTASQLWAIKTGRQEQKDISSLPYVEYGNKAEEHIRALYALDHPEKTITFTPFKIIRNKDHPFIFATPDGEVEENGQQGGWECKTTEIRRGSDWKKWDNRIPDNYYIQILHQLLATEWDFVDLKARIRHRDIKGTLLISEKEYRLERSECKEDLEYLLQKEIRFWDYVTTNRQPPDVLPAI